MRTIPGGWRFCLLVATLACAATARAQTESASLVKSARIPSVEMVPTKFDVPAESSEAVSDSAPEVPDSGDPTSAVTKTVHHEPSPSERFQWKLALGQSALYTVVMDGWRFSDEPGTRDATGNGPWFEDWIDSVGETRGWDDGDGWHASYVGHSFEGAIFGFIEQQNDPLYRKVEWATAVCTG